MPGRRPNTRGLLAGEWRVRALPVARRRRQSRSGNLIEIPVRIGAGNKPCRRAADLAAATRCRVRRNLRLGATGRCGGVSAADRAGATVAKGEADFVSRHLGFQPSRVPPAGAVWGLVWYQTHRDEVKSLPSLYPALCKIGLGLSISPAIMFVIWAFCTGLPGGTLLNP